VPPVPVMVPELVMVAAPSDRMPMFPEILPELNTMAELEASMPSPVPVPEMKPELVTLTLPSRALVVMPAPPAPVAEIVPELLRTVTVVTAAIPA